MSRALTRFSQWFNASMMPVHAIALLSIPLLLGLGRIPLEESGVFLWLGGFTAVVLLASSLSYNQGDRLTLAAAPLWSVLYPALAARWRPTALARVGGV